MNAETTLIVGANGQLSQALQTKYPNAKVVGSHIMDISSQEKIEAFDWTGIKTIINAGAYTNVDGAERPEGRISSWKINAIGAANLARVAIQNDFTLVHISSDYVFDGTISPHTEKEDFSPLGIYGQSKAAGDIAVSLVHKHYILVIRTLQHHVQYSYIHHSAYYSDRIHDQR